MLLQIGFYCFEDENGIVFNAYKSKSNLKTDYDQYLIRKYVQEYIEKENKTNVVCKEEFYKYNGNDFFKFSFGIKINSYSQIEESVRELVEINKYINKRAKDIFTSATMPVPIYYPEIYLNEFIGEIGHDIEYYDAEYYTKKVKIDYINYLYKNNVEDANVSKEDMVNYYKPEQLVVYNNGKKIKINRSNRDIEVFASYRIKKNDYCIQLHFIIESIEAVDNYEINNVGQLVSFVCNGKKYILDSDLNMKSEIKGNKVPYEWTASNLVEFFGGNVEYDYENGNIFFKL